MRRLGFALACCFACEGHGEVINRYGDAKLSPEPFVIPNVHPTERAAQLEVCIWFGSDGDREAGAIPHDLQLTVDVVDAQGSLILPLGMTSWGQQNLCQTGALRGVQREDIEGVRLAVDRPFDARRIIVREVW